MVNQPAVCTSANLFAFRAECLMRFIAVYVYIWWTETGRKSMQVLSPVEQLYFVRIISGLNAICCSAEGSITIVSCLIGSLWAKLRAIYLDSTAKKDCPQSHCFPPYAVSAWFKLQS